MIRHGGNIWGKDVLDFSANISPFLLPAIKEAVRASADMINVYPDPYCTALAESIGRYEGVPADRIVCGNGAADLIYRIVRAISPKKAVIMQPTFTEYEKALREAGCDISCCTLLHENGFVPDKSLPDMIDSDTDIVFICSPNNPTGIVCPEDILIAAAEKCVRSGAVLVCDECFMGFVLPERRASLRDIMNSNSIVLKAFTKIFAMPGLRLGYGIFCDEGIAERVRSCGQCWSVSVPAQAAGIAAMEHIGEIEDIPQYIARMREYIYTKMDDIGIEYIRSDANFILFRAEEGLERRMLGRGIMIRSCDDMLTSGYYRTAVRTLDENKRLIAALEECVHG